MANISVNYQPGLSGLTSGISISLQKFCNFSQRSDTFSKCIYQIKNHKRVKKVGHNSEFLFGIY